MIIVIFSPFYFVLYECSVNFCFAVDLKLLKLTVVVHLTVTVLILRMPFKGYYSKCYAKNGAKS
jgi:hypothetical protein